jgi:proline iminopeptidase
MSRLHEKVEVGGGARLWTTWEGDGTPIVLCHGGPGGVDNLAAVSAMLIDVARVYRYEQRGGGRSSGGGPFTMEQALADLDVLRRHWEHDRWIVLGHSFGAGLALAFGLEHPQATAAVIYLSCVVRLAGQPDWYEQYRARRLERLSPAARSRYIELRQLRDRLDPFPDAFATELAAVAIDTDLGDERIAPRLRWAMQKNFTAVNASVNRELGSDFVRYFNEPGISERLAALGVPVLLVHGTADPRPIAAVNALAAGLPNARVVGLDGVGHMPFLEAPEQVRATLRQFIQSLQHDARCG